MTIELQPLLGLLGTGHRTLHRGRVVAPIRVFIQEPCPSDELARLARVVQQVVPAQGYTDNLTGSGLLMIVVHQACWNIGLC